ncbi:tape measure protein [Larkinella sp. VNQ87]|uniref:tape measure protein n=1 Tax=Larkinella sp. VNQ87 TaxID=3400921 RepID=UPI003C10497B
MNYSWAFRLQDLVSPTLMQISQRYGSTVSTMQRLTERLQSGFSRAAQTVDQLKRKMGFAKEGHSIDSLRQKLDALTRQRDLSLDLGEVRRANREIDALERKLNKLESSGKKSGGLLGGLLGGGLMGSVTGLVVGGGLLAGAGQLLQSGMNREQTKVAYEQFVGKEGVDQLMGKLNNFANVTPYSNEQVYGAGRALLAAKVSANELESKMTNIGNMAAVSQKDFEEMSAAYAKIKAKGFIDSGELHQEFGGTLLMDQLKKDLGVTGEELFKLAEDRKIRFEDVDRAIANLSANGGAYQGGLDKLSQTAGGKWSTFTGTLQDKLATWAEKLNPFLGKIFDFGTALIGQIDPFLAKLAPLGEGFMKVWDALQPVRDLLADLFTVVTNLLSPFSSMESNVSGLNVVLEIFADVVWVISTAVKWVGELILWLADSAIVKAILVVGLLVKGWWALNAAMYANPVGAVIAAIVALVAMIKYAWDNVEWFRNSLIKLWEVGKAVFSSLGKAWEAFKNGDFAGVGKAFADGWKEGLANADRAINTDKMSRRMAAEQAKMKKVSTPAMAANGLAPGSGTPSGKELDKAAGVSATVGGSKSTTITINVNKLIEKSEIHVNHFKEGVNEMEEMIQDAVLRALNSANAVATP